MSLALALDARISSRDVELAVSIQRGERVGIVGPNGAGKSTVIDALAGRLRPGKHDQFRVSRPAAPGPGKLGVLTQKSALFEHMSVLENVAYGPRSLGAGKDAANRCAREWLERVGLENLWKARPRELSGGQAQRVAIARTLANDPEVLLLDEPCAALDVEAAAQVRRILAREGQGRTLVFVSHDALDVLQLCTRVVELERGRVVADQVLEDAESVPHGEFFAAMLGKRWVVGRYRAGTFTSRGGVECAARAPKGLLPGEAPGEGVRVSALVDPQRFEVSDGALPLGDEITRVGATLCVMCGDIPVARDLVSGANGVMREKVSLRPSAPLATRMRAPRTTEG